ncbi:MAG: DUF6427 family protein [Bacteroidales bacterium]|nr:DUF6427 family protein [Bacteroidales bacterium]MDD4670362.1 DUF6427 family protein [Bacteroidales bacterium]
MKTRNTAILLIGLICVLWCSAFFINPEPIRLPQTLFLDRIVDSDYLFGHNLLSAVLSGVFLLAIAASTFFFNSAFSSGINYLLPTLYMFLVLSNPYSVWFTPFHISGLLLIWTSFYSAKYRVTGQQFGDLFMIFFFLTISSFFYGGTIWMFPALLFINLMASEHKFKYIVTSIVGLLLPLVLLSGINYLVNGWEDTLLLLQRYVGQLIDIEHKTIMFTAAEICRFVIIAIFTIISAYHVFSNLDRYKIVKSKSYLRVLLYLFVLLLIMLIFVSNNKYPFGIIMYFPISLLFYEYITENAKKRIGIYLFVFAIVFLAERMIYFIR